jgi:hypothetical protein
MRGRSVFFLSTLLFPAIHQFALISVSYAKLQLGRGLADSLITLNYAYLS